MLVARRVKSLNEVATRCQEIGSPSVLVVPADVSKPDECWKFIDTTISNFGRCKSNVVLFFFLIKVEYFINFIETER